MHAQNFASCNQENGRVVKKDRGSSDYLLIGIDETEVYSRGGAKKRKVTTRKVVFLSLSLTLY
jgi:hypothetical protein